MSKYWLLTLIPFLGGLVLTAYEARVALTEHVLRRMGRRAEAVVTGHTASREGTYPALHPVVRWTDEHGEEQEHAVAAAGPGAHRLSEGAVVRVIHTPGVPGTAVLDTPERYKTAVFGMWLGVLLWAGALTAVLIRIATLLPTYRY
ncbi:DUF3592 domain-containing protein [Streptomyces sp. S3(2020)]|uniref:DUF3592 domain-containing protein n=1 Tax=Streptomyces sp. S3(2020) TaxID=2732044 RepID=UPI0014894577|nr:DUF3592 domain-containing protein [Streptomyces sp. S3(2020)]NNN38088.1 DUF3592 domain-containing protein [Streptomyces sp. S3(2020)]